jgi:MerR family transcriptional regulator, light-induced transcriptional regulator
MSSSSESAALLIRKNQQKLAEAIIEMQYARQPAVWKPYGHPGREKSVRDAGYHLLYLAEALESDDQGLFSEYLAWVQSLFAGLGFSGNVLPTSLECTRKVLETQLPEDCRTPALEMIQNGMHSLSQDKPTHPESFIAPDNLLARSYLDALLEGNRQLAGKIVLDAVKSGLSVREAYLNVFQITQREVGRLWQINQLSVAQEHFCSAATQMIMSQLYPYIFNGERKNRRMIMACVGGELHEIGARMVADFFEMEGWDTYFLGANTPLESILPIARKKQIDLLGLSATITLHVSKVRDIIQELHSEDTNPPRVLVGGYPFNLSPDLWKRIGADGYAPDAQTALREAERLLA